MFTIFTPEQINQGIQFVVNLFLLVLGTSVGTFTRELIFPKDNNIGENIGFSVFSGITVFGILQRFPDISVEYSFLICFFLGFFLPSFKDWFQGKKLLRILTRVFKQTKSMKDAVIDSIAEELDNQENKSSKEDVNNKGE